MKTNIENTAIPEAIATALRANNASLYRLAEQLDRSPHELAADILRAGIEAVDGCLGEFGEVDSPLYLEVTSPDYAVAPQARITTTLDAASPEELEALEAEGNGIPQAALWHRAVARLKQEGIVTL
jgi:hypothetical protein